jgi:hypothetical protein
MAWQNTMPALFLDLIFTACSWKQVKVPKLKNMGQRKIMILVLKPAQRRSGTMHALNTTSSVKGAWSIKIGKIIYLPL